jgi:hypothetical protein
MITLSRDRWQVFGNTKLREQARTDNPQAASLVSMALTIAMVHYGYGKTRYLLQPAQMTSAMKFSNFAILVNGFAMAFLKISIGLSLLRLQLGNGMKWIVWGSMFLSIVVNMLVIVTSLFGCRPLAAVWDRSLMPVATCLPRSVSVANSYTQTSKSSDLSPSALSAMRLTSNHSRQHPYRPLLQPQPVVLPLESQSLGL